MDEPWSPIGNSYHVLYQAPLLEVNCIGVVINGLDRLQKVALLQKDQKFNFAKFVLVLSLKIIVNCQLRINAENVTSRL